MRAVNARQMDINLMLVTKQWMDNSPRAISVRQTNINLMVIAIQLMDGNPRVKSACLCGQHPVRDRGRIEDLPTKKMIHTIFSGPCKVGSSHHARDRYAKEARRPPQALVHKTEVRHTRDIVREPTDIVFTEADAK